MKLGLFGADGYISIVKQQFGSILNIMHKTMQKI